MKIHLPVISLLVLCWACKPSTSKQTSTAEPSIEIKGLVDSLHGPMDTTVRAPEIEEKKETSTPRITNRLCNPNFTLLAKPAKNKQLFYVTGFDHQEFKCWEEMQFQAIKACGDQPCIIYYVDMADIKVIPTAPDLIDPAVLREHGIGKFQYDGKYWSLNGASIWKRSGNGWSYYTTNNQFGG